MKKRFIRLFACVLAVSAVLSMGACGDEKKNVYSETVSSAVSEVHSEVSSESVEEVISAEETKTGYKKYATVEEWLESDDAGEEYKVMAEMNDDPNSMFGMKGEGNKLILTIRIDESIADELAAGADPEEVEILKEEMRETIAEEADGDFKIYAEVIKAKIDAEDPHLVVRCVDADGTEIVSEEFRG